MEWACSFTITKPALLVDSEPPVSEILQEILKSEGMEVVTLVSGSDAADYAHGQKFHDLSMRRTGAC